MSLPALALPSSSKRIARSSESISSESDRFSKPAGFLKSAGFSLVELLTTLALLALATSLVVVTLPDNRAHLHSEGARLAAHITILRQIALQQGRSVALRLDSDGYGFDWRTGGAWQPIPTELMTSRKLPAQITIHISEDIEPISPPLPSESSLSSEYSLPSEFSNTAATTPPPRIIFDSLGTVGHSVDIILRERNIALGLHINAIGDVTIVRGAES